MIALDSNILVYAHMRKLREHERAYEAVRSLAEGSYPWAIPTACLYEFLAVVTNPGKFDRPSTLSEGLEQIDAWLEAPGVTILQEPPFDWSDLNSYLREVEVNSRSIHDARIAYSCLKNGVSEFWTADSGFRRFPRLTVTNPLTLATDN